MDTVKVRCKVATDGSGYTLSGDIEPVKAYILEHADDTYWGKYNLLIPLESIVQQSPEKTKEALQKELQTDSENSIEGVKITAERGYVLEQ